MISCEVMGRLGNQMFCIAATHSMALDNNDVAVFPHTITGITPTEREVKLHRKTVLRKLKYVDNLSFIEHVHVEPQNHTYSPIEYKKNLFLRGYFQSEKYFKHNRKQILEFFEPLEQIDNFLNKKYSNIVNNEMAVSLHIRRGDYLKYTDYHAIVGKEYYDKAKKYFTNKHTYVIFSDDIEWCKETFKEDNNVFIENQDDVLDLYLMSKIPNNIIANSSFSWWGAWLNTNESKKVVAPSSWFGPHNEHLNIAKKDLIPEDWIVVE